TMIEPRRFDEVRCSSSASSSCCGVSTPSRTSSEPSVCQMEALIRAGAARDPRIRSSSTAFIGSEGLFLDPRFTATCSDYASRVTKPLWAPWRLEYVRQADEQEGCIFCHAGVPGGDELVVHRGTRALVMLNKFPYASGHLMVAPLRHVGSFGELEDAEALEIH